jgi:hypothetical protein
MKIRQIGENSVWLLAKEEKVLVDPSKDLMADKKYESRIVLFSKQELNFMGLDSTRVVVFGPGEYEVGGVDISGYDNNNGESVIYSLNVEGVTIVMVAVSKEKLTEKTVERIRGADVMLIMSKGEVGVEIKSLLSTAKKWGINYLVPVGMKGEELKTLLDDLDREDSQREKELTVDKDNLPDGMEVVLLGGK